MPFGKKLEKFLKENKVKHELIKHKIVYTAYDKTKTLRVPDKIVGKTLVLKIDRDLAIGLIPANKNLDKNKFKKIAKTKKIDFVSERIMKNKLRGVKVGATPPFGVLWGLPTFVERTLFSQPKIIINSGEWNISIKINPVTLRKLIPDLIIGNFSEKKSGNFSKKK